jgi:hypothetical protein
MHPMKTGASRGFNNSSNSRKRKGQAQRAQEKRARKGRGSNTAPNKETIRKRRKEANLSVQLYIIIIRFFPGLVKSFKALPNGKRGKNLGVALMTRILAVVFNLGTMDSIAQVMNNDMILFNIAKIMGIEEADAMSCQVVNQFLKELDPAAFGDLYASFAKTPIDKKIMQDCKVAGLWQAVIDGSAIFNKTVDIQDEDMTSGFVDDLVKSCPNCTFKVHKDKSIGMEHTVPEAKILVKGCLAISIAKQFIENRDTAALLKQRLGILPDGSLPNPGKGQGAKKQKQACGLKAFEVVAEKMASFMGERKIVVLMDSLCACERVFKMFDEKGWSYILRFQAGGIPSLNRRFEAGKDKAGCHACHGRNAGKLLSVKYMNGLIYNRHTINMLGCELEDRENSFKFPANMPVARKNCLSLRTAGRRRWTIEETFNNQKSHGCNLMHQYVRGLNGSKASCCLMQLGCAISKLMELGFRGCGHLRCSQLILRLFILVDFCCWVLTDLEIARAEKDNIDVFNVILFPD